VRPRFDSYVCVFASPSQTRLPHIRPWMRTSNTDTRTPHPHKPPKNRRCPPSCTPPQPREAFSQGAVRPSASAAQHSKTHGRNRKHTEEIENSPRLYASPRRAPVHAYAALARGTCRRRPLQCQPCRTCRGRAGRPSLTSSMHARRGGQRCSGPSAHVGDLGDAVAGMGARSGAGSVREERDSMVSVGMSRSQVIQAVILCRYRCNCKSFFE
jgi:hypothetical protein